MGIAGVLRRSGLRAGLLVLVLLFLSMGVAGPAIANPGADGAGFEAGGDGPEPPDPPPPGPQDEAVPPPPEEPPPPPPPPGDDGPSGGGSGGGYATPPAPPTTVPPTTVAAPEPTEVADGAPGKEADQAEDEDAAPVVSDADGSSSTRLKVGLGLVSAALLSTALLVAYLLWRRSGEDEPEPATF
jgi:hypothetical protein